MVLFGLLTLGPVNRINEFNLEPGVYAHHKGSLYVVTDIVTHMDNAKGKMEALADPLVVFRDLQAPVRHVNGKAQAAHHAYAHPLSEFRKKFQPK